MPSGSLDSLLNRCSVSWLRHVKRGSRNCQEEVPDDAGVGTKEFEAHVLRTHFSALERFATGRAKAGRTRSG